MNMTLIAHDPETGKIQLYRMTLIASIERTGRTDEFGQHEVHARQVAGRDFVDGDVGAALAEVLDLDVAPEGGEGR